MTRKPLVAGNWKMHHTRASTRTWCGNFTELLNERPLPGTTSAAEIAVAPPFTAIDSLREHAAGLPVIVSAQNCHWEPSGAFTGELAPGMLKELGCELVIVGHSERRQLFGESDKTAGKKVAAVIGAAMIPVLCVGESAMQRESGRTEPIIEAQLRNGLGELVEDEIGDVIVAYEPVWAIGTGDVATPAQAQQTHRFLRGILASIVGSADAARVRILYGGSVKPSNAAELAELDDVDGFLVGGASLDPASFLEIVRAWN